MKKFAKIGALFMSFVLVIVATVGITLAYLTNQTSAVTNTFIARSGLLENAGTFKLYESAVRLNDAKDGYIQDETKIGQQVTENDYENLLAGMELYKDPTLSVGKVTAPAYLYLKITKTIPADLEWKLDGFEGENPKWQAIADINGAEEGTGLGANETLYVYVHYEEDEGTNVIPAETTIESLNLIEDKKVTVGQFDAEDMDGEDEAQLIFQAYLCQSTGFATPAAAFATCFTA